MKNRDRKMLELCFQQATDAPPVRHARISACLAIKNQIISFGYNHRRTHPLQKQFAKNSHAIYLHAEIHSIVNALNQVDKSDLKNATMYIARAKKNPVGRGNSKYTTSPGLAKPCQGCQSAIAAFGIKKVFYTQDDLPEAAQL